MSSNNKKHTKQFEIKIKLPVHKNYIKIRRDNGVRPRKNYPCPACYEIIYRHKSNLLCDIDI